MSNVMIPQTDWRKFQKEWKRLQDQVDRLEGIQNAIQWKRPKDTGLSPKQLEVIRRTQPHKVKPIRAGAKSYLYNT